MILIFSYLSIAYIGFKNGVVEKSQEPGENQKNIEVFLFSKIETSSFCQVHSNIVLDLNPFHMSSYFSLDTF